MKNTKLDSSAIVLDERKQVAHDRDSTASCIGIGANKRARGQYPQLQDPEEDPEESPDEEGGMDDDDSF